MFYKIYNYKYAAIDVFSSTASRKTTRAFEAYRTYTNHSRKSIYVSITFLIYCLHQIQCQVTKCCPTGSVLDIQTEYTCELPTNRLHWEAYNILPPALLTCSEFRHIYVEDYRSYVELNGCIDKNLNDQYVAISCSPDSTVGVHFINKCCPFGEIYDHTNRICAQNSDFNGYFKRVFGYTAVVFKTKVPDCSENEVFVEYHSGGHNIQFDGMNLKVNGHDLSPNKYCIDDLMNINPNEYNQDVIQFIVRSCRPRSICGETPCYRRCCKTDQVLKKGSKQKQCVQHPENKNLIPEFYDVITPVTNPQRQIYVKGTHPNE